MREKGVPSPLLEHPVERAMVKGNGDGREWRGGGGRVCRWGVRCATNLMLRAARPKPLYIA
jgi:hypothetical protein